MNMLVLIVTHRPGGIDWIALARRIHGERPEQPFRAPHWTASAESIFGGQRPGEIELANGGVLLLLQLDEHSRPAIERLAQTLQTGRLENRRGRWPIGLQLIATTSPAGLNRLAALLPLVELDDRTENETRLSGPLSGRL